MKQIVINHYKHFNWQFSQISRDVLIWQVKYSHQSNFNNFGSLIDNKKVVLENIVMTYNKRQTFRFINYKLIMDQNIPNWENPKFKS